MPRSICSFRRKARATSLRCGNFCLCLLSGSGHFRRRLVCQNPGRLGGFAQPLWVRGVSFSLSICHSRPGPGFSGELRADAPLLPHNVKPKMIPSTAKGKKAFTSFRRIAESPKGWALWEATVDFFRPHQIRAHAAVLGLPILGDDLYGGPGAPTQRDLLPKKQRARLHLPVFHGRSHSPRRSAASRRRCRECYCV